MASTFESPVGIDPKKTSLNSLSPTPEMLQYDAPLQDMQLDDAQTVLLSLSGYEDANGFWYCHNCPISHLDEAQYTAPVDRDELNTFDPLTDMLGSKLCDLDSFEEKASPSDAVVLRIHEETYCSVCQGCQKWKVKRIGLQNGHWKSFVIIWFTRILSMSMARAIG
ncbi:hypothetical protein FOXG_14053 [Fusarium oxysporum f. sp. lycopersici 4287]|uniref:Uncharacterized protein n=2 Tax=Fusarium oxysporum TaxID=5507 RepID=A0A0J9VXM0_FUSO4|nr:hypothetical protein FOXG_12486 [Fusarium oxysporum f. sp. lycopersici 4287]XP_018253593.1 hypothetical protein FOXG_14053 [Fusarium oxysporum f. sp. lycopersici 4287]KNB13806.1 hypothetical protein FOXG_12486 [Fusarium oxysporum f. sp. lycopersici 4287]KNB15548.1 hypothetical protein FOXG_14053 [Fusarium oxysporum f. sp. lycopersici 4287]